MWYEADACIAIDFSCSWYARHRSLHLKALDDTQLEGSASILAQYQAVVAMLAEKLLYMALLLWLPLTFSQLLSFSTSLIHTVPILFSFPFRHLRSFSELFLRRKVPQKIHELINWRRQHGGKVLKVRAVGRTRVTACRCDHFRTLELVCQTLALFLREQLLQSRHILVRFMVNVGV